MELEDPNFGDEVEEFEEDESENWTNSLSLDNLDWDPSDLEDEEIEDPTLQQNPSFTNSRDKVSSHENNPFEISEDDDFDEEELTATNFDSLSQPFDFDPTNSTDDDDFEFGVTNLKDLDVNLSSSDIDYDDLPPLNLDEDDESDDITGSPTFVVSSENQGNSQESDLVDLEEMLTSTGGDFLDDLSDDDYGDYSSALEPLTTPSGSFATKNQTNSMDEDDEDQPLAFGDDEKFFLAPDDLTIFLTFHPIVSLPPSFPNLNKPKPMMVLMRKTKAVVLPLTPLRSQ